MNITHTDFLLMHVTDFEKSVDFYENTLELKFSKKYGERPGGELETGNLTIQVLEAKSFGLEFKTGQPIALNVEDVAEARKELEAKGVHFVQDTMDTGVCHQAIFVDPDGNPLILHHRYAPRD